MLAIGVGLLLAVPASAWAQSPPSVPPEPEELEAAPLHSSVPDPEQLEAAQPRSSVPEPEQLEAAPLRSNVPEPEALEAPAPALAAPGPAVPGPSVPAPAAPGPGVSEPVRVAPPPEAAEPPPGPTGLETPTGTSRRPLFAPARRNTVPSSGSSGSVGDFFGTDQAGGSSLTAPSGGVERSGEPDTQSSGQSGSSVYPY